MTNRGQDGAVRPLRIVRAHSFDGPVLITGGAGFIGCNLADRLLARGVPVVMLDNLARAGVERNVAWLRDRHRRGLRVEIGDVRDAQAVRRVIPGVRAVFHFAAQVAVTTSVVDPIADFEVNARGTLNVLEAVRGEADPPRVIFTSTNKVYGGLRDVPLTRGLRRYEPVDPAVAAVGIGEDRALDFHSPYGCSKGTADQYVLDYGRTYGLQTVVLRMSCIYGQRQCGNEDQGWVAHFLIRALADEPITLYGDGRQVRDVLYIDDLLDAFELAHAAGDRLAGQAFNIGGGRDYAVSLLDVIDLVGALRGSRPRVQTETWRPGDQRYYVSDIRRFARATGWQPRVAPAAGIARLHDWLVTELQPPRARLKVAREMV